MKITEQMIKDFEATTGYWMWKLENISRNKGEWPGNNRIARFQNSCAFCHHFMGGGENPCKKCYLYKKKICSAKGGFVYSKSVYAKTDEERKKYVKKIYKACKKYLQILKKQYKKY